MRWAQWSFITEVSGIPWVFITRGSAFYMFRSLAPEGELWCLAGQGSWGLSVEVFTSFLNCAVFVSRDAVWPVQGEHLHIWSSHIWSSHQSHSSPCPRLPCHYLSTPAHPTFYSSSASRGLRTHLCTLPPTQPRSLKPEKHFFSGSCIAFHYHNILSQFRNGSGGAPFLFMPTERTKLSTKIFSFRCNWNGCWLPSQKPERQFYLTV